MKPENYIHNNYRQQLIGVLHIYCAIVCFIIKMLSYIKIFILMIKKINHKAIPQPLHIVFF